MKKIKQTLEKALVEAGAILKRGIERPIKVQYKSPISLVTETDKKAERTIIDIIHRKFPNHSILAEESGEQYLPLSFPRKRESKILDPRRSDRSVPDDRAADRRLTDWRLKISRMAHNRRQRQSCHD